MPALGPPPLAHAGVARSSPPPPASDAPPADARWRSPGATGARGPWARTGSAAGPPPGKGRARPPPPPPGRPPPPEGEDPARLLLPAPAGWTIRADAGPPHQRQGSLRQRPERRHIRKERLRRRLRCLLHGCIYTL